MVMNLTFQIATSPKTATALLVPAIRHGLSSARMVVLALVLSLASEKCFLDYFYTVVIVLSFRIHVFP